MDVRSWLDESFQREVKQTLDLARRLEAAFERASMIDNLLRECNIRPPDEVILGKQDKIQFTWKDHRQPSMRHVDILARAHDAIFKFHEVNIADRENDFKEWIPVIDRYEIIGQSFRIEPFLTEYAVVR